MAYTERGTVRGLEGIAVRKHHKFIEPMEYKYIEKRLVKAIKDNKLLRTSKHVLDNVNDGKLNYKEHLVIESIKDWKNCLIEYTIREDGKERILLRSKVKFSEYLENKGEYRYVNQCAVIQLDNMLVVTAWLTEADDHHESLNWSRYSNNKTIIRLPNLAPSYRPDKKC